LSIRKNRKKRTPHSALRTPHYALRIPYSVCKKLTLFICPAAVFFFDKSQKKTAAGRWAGAFAPATPFLKTECGKRKTENGKRNL